jgi:hypothetical protein
MRMRQGGDTTVTAPLRAVVFNTAVGLAAGALFLMPPALLPDVLGYSAYMFGMGAVLLCAGLRGSVSALASGAVVVVGAVLTDQRSGVDYPQLGRPLPPRRWWSSASRRPCCNRCSTPGRTLC